MAEEIGLKMCGEWSGSFGAVPIPENEDGDCGYIAMTWYKERGRVGTAVVLYDGDAPRALTLKDAEAACSAETLEEV